MSKYTLVAVNKEDNSEHIINVYDIEAQKYKESVHIKDIDSLTSRYLNGYDFLIDLKEQEIINFTRGHTYIMSEYNGCTYYYKTIYHSPFIHSASSTVVSGFINSQKVEQYPAFYHEFMGALKNDPKFQKEIVNAKYITTPLKTLIQNYYAYSGTTNIEEELLEHLHIERSIESEIKRYKTLRGLYLWMQEYKKIKQGICPTNNSVCNLNIRTKKRKTQPMVIQKEPRFKEGEYCGVARDVDRYNQQYEEFLSEDEYSRAYGDGEDYEEERKRGYKK